MRRVPWHLRQLLYNNINYDLRKFPKQTAILKGVDDRLDTILIAGGVGASKSWTTAYYLLPEIVYGEGLRILNGWPTMGVYPQGFSKPALEGAVNPLFEPTLCWLVGDNYKQPRKEWAFLYNAIKRNPWLWQTCGGIVEAKTAQGQDGEWSFETGQGVIVVTKSWDNPESLHSEKVALMAAVEAGLLNAYLYEERLLPRVIKAGGLMVLNGTFETAVGPFFGELYTRGLDTSLDAKQKSWSIASWDNPYLYPGGWDDPQMVRARATTSTARFNERYGAIPNRPHGLVHAYYSVAVHTANRNTAVDPTLPVRIGVDPGPNGYGLVAMQVRGEARSRKAAIVDEYFDEDGSTTEKCITWLLKQPWAAQVTGGAIDATQLEQQRIWSNGAVWSFRNPTTLRGVALAARKVPIVSGIERVNTLLHSHVILPGDELVDFDGDSGTPRLFIAPRCTRLIKEFTRLYHYPKDSAEDSKAAKPIDKGNHLSKALAYLLVDEFGFVEPERRRYRGGIVNRQVLSGARLRV